MHSYRRDGWPRSGTVAGQLLADLGADVICVDRSAGKADPTDINRRHKRSIAQDLKRAEGTAACKRLIASADAVIERFHPGVTERLNLGPHRDVRFDASKIDRKRRGCKIANWTSEGMSDIR
jgi:crotonobetainyl-CoA:carnitine CoA-transferase CaiB-like acyl-CoA transferase